jgi:hypothetical protein
LFAVPFDMVFEAGLPELARNTPVGEVEVNIISVVSDIFSVVPRPFSDWTVIAPDGVLGSIVCGFVTKTKLAVSAYAGAQRNKIVKRRSVTFFILFYLN